MPLAKIRGLMLLIVKSLLLGYLLLLLLLFLFQRHMLYHPPAKVFKVHEVQISFNHQGLKLDGWVLNPGQSQAILYYGGNAEQIIRNREFFNQALSHFTIYMIPYRGYSGNDGVPSESGLFADALYIYDQIKDKHQSISAIGRSLGSGVASYVAAKRQIDNLVLITPYDSIANVAKGQFPYVPINLLMRDKYQSWQRAPLIKARTLVLIAQNDRIVPPQRAEALLEHFSDNPLTAVTIVDADHNNIDVFPQYRQTLAAFLAP